MTSRRRRCALLLAALALLTLSGCKVSGAAAAPAAPQASALLPPVPPTSSPTIAGAHQAEYVYPITADIDTVVVNGGAANIWVYGSDRSDVKVVAKTAYSATPPAITRAISGATLTVGYTCLAQTACGVALDIYVPNGTAVQTATSTGSTWLIKVSGPVTATAQAGFIGALGLTSQTANFSTQEGGMDVKFAVPPSHVTVGTRAGYITVAVPQTVAYNVTVAATMGYADITVPQNTLSARTISVGTGFGSVNIVPSPD